MKPKLPNERGQALILIALAAVGIFSITALAIDGSAKYADRRHAQNAADTAALAGALEMAREKSHGNGVGVKCPPESGTPTVACADVITAALDRAEDNGYNGDPLKNTVEVNIPPKTGYYSTCGSNLFDCNDYVQVIITSHVDTWFARVLGIEKQTNIVQAVASSIAEDNHFNFGGNAVVALRPSGCGLMSNGGSFVDIEGGGMYSNSSDTGCSFVGGSCASSLTVTDSSGNQGDITLVGGYTAGGCTPNADLLAGAAIQLPFPPPFEEMPEPAECSTPGTFTKVGSTITLQPGYFAKIPGNGNPWNANLYILKPGVYCIGSTFNFNNNQVVKVDGLNPGVDPGVLLYFKPGGSYTINGGAGIKLWGINDANLAINPDLETYKGYLMYVTPNYASGSQPTCYINGHSGIDYPEGDVFMGTIFAPNCRITINGKTDSTGWQTQLIGYDVRFMGGANVYLTYDEDSSPIWTIPLQVGLLK